MKIQAFNATIRRDAHTITPITVPEHEIAILQTIFGEESVHNSEGRTIAENKLTDADVAGEIELSEGEFDRLAAKYGGNDEGLFVEQVYGKRATGGLDKAIERYAEVGQKIQVAGHIDNGLWVLGADVLNRIGEEHLCRVRVDGPRLSAVCRQHDQVAAVDAQGVSVPGALEA